MNLANLKEIAEKAQNTAPGPWKLIREDKPMPSGRIFSFYDFQYTDAGGETYSLHDTLGDEHTTRFCVEFNPTTALALIARVERAEEILARVGEYGPPQGEIHTGTACAFCDMGGAGYASRGDGFHDDKCAVKDAQVFLAQIQGEK